VAFYTRSEISENKNPAIPEEEFVSYLKKNLPPYMIPAHFILVEKIPLKIQMKVDVQALREIFQTYLGSKVRNGEVMWEEEGRSWEQSREGGASSR
jgi:acyl-coenzyme A synthetase/AMP-(fatty) acid ligase